MRKFERITAALLAAFLLWVALSWLDVVTDNIEPNPTHSKYNAFVVLVELMEV